MNPILRPAPLFVCASLLLAGCAAATHSVPTYSQDHTVTDIPPFSIAISKCYWTDNLLQGQIPQDMLANMPPEVREQYLRTPAGGQFLVIEITVTNTGDKPAMFPGDQEGAFPVDQPPVFTLQNNTNGAVYGWAGFRSTAGLLANFVMNRGVAINPGASADGFIAFAVPSGSYELRFSSGRWIGGSSYLAQWAQGWPLFNWALNPGGG
jgi:hypothetical protein